MKKIMITSGSFSAAAMILGILFKFMHWPGASVLITLGIGSSSLIFLPLLFILKSKDKHQTKDKILLGLGILAGILISLSVLFKVMHWPGVMFLGYSTIILIGLVLLPIFFITGIKNPENKINTIAISIVMIMVCGLWLTLVISPKGMEIIRIKNTTVYLLNEQIVATEKKLCANLCKNDSSKNEMLDLTNQIVDICDQIKSSIVIAETGVSKISDDFKAKNLTIGLGNFDEFKHDKIKILNNLIKKYKNKSKTKTLDKIMVINSNKDEFDVSYKYYNGSNIEVLSQLTQIQLIVLQNEIISFTN